MHQKLISYSTSAIAFILLHDANAQAVYTDIDPDILLDNNGDNYSLNLDEGGGIDFRFNNVSAAFGGYFTSGGIFYIPYNLFQEIIVTNLDDVSFAGTKFTYSTYSSGSFKRFFPFALDADILINSELTFQPAYKQLLAIKTLGTYANDGGGNWYPEIADHYLGIKFIDNFECAHYGWIRCDVLDGGRTLIIKDYAYETKCDVGILAGDKVGDTTVHIENINSPDANIYSFENTIYADVKDLNEKTEVTIYSISGDLIYTETLTELNTEIPFSMPKGIYIVKVISKNLNYTKKVFIN